MTLPIRTRPVPNNNAAHLADHNTLHAFYNAFLEDHSGVRYVTIDGDDGKDGRTWQTAKSTIAGASASGGTISTIYIGSGMADTFDVDDPIELADQRSYIGIGPGTNNGTKIQATASLGTDPLFVNASGNLTSGGLFNLQVRGTLDGSGGVGLLIQNGAIADSWTINNCLFGSFTSHGIHLDIPSGQVAGNPLLFGMVNVFSNGQGGTGDGLRIEKAFAGTIHIDYLGGDNNFGSLLHVDTMNSTGRVRVDELKAERSTTGRHQDVVLMTAPNGGCLDIGGLRIFHNVSGGVDGNSLIRSTDSTLRVNVGFAFISTSGSNTYTYGYQDTVDSVVLADFVQKPWLWDAAGIGMRHGTGIFVRKGSPEGVYTAPPGSYAGDATNGEAYIKHTGTGNTGWVRLARADEI